MKRSHKLRFFYGTAILIYIVNGLFAGTKFS
jgi:hypothetical protein